MIKKFYNPKLSEEKIINSFLKKLNFNKIGTFNFENDAAYLNISKNNKIVVTTDTIIENIDFFPKDPPESIAQKIICVNLSDISAMGAVPKAYTLNLSINSKINYMWLKKFTNRLNKLQKKYNIYLLGGDISNSKETSLTVTCFGEAKLKNIISQKNCHLGDDVWVTGNLGNSFLGYQSLKNIKLNIKKKYTKKFINNYLYPEPCMFGSKAYKYINSAIDILSTSWGQSQMIERNGPITVEENFENSAAPLRNLIKDLNILEDLRLQLGLELPVTQASSKVANDTNNMGLTEPDIAATALTIKKLSSIE